MLKKISTVLVAAGALAIATPTVFACPDHDKEKSGETPKTVDKDKSKDKDTAKKDDKKKDEKPAEKPTKS
jgi:hypothetical protein